MFPVTTPTLTNTDNYSLVKNYVFNLYELDLFNLFYFLLGVIAIITIILLMQNNSISEVNSNNNENNPRRYSSTELTARLIIQLRHNIDNPGYTLAYNRFPENHPGHLRLELRNKLVSILRTSMLSDQYKFGCTIGTIYKRGTYSYPEVSPEMAGVVMSAEVPPGVDL